MGFQLNKSVFSPLSMFKFFSVLISAFPEYADMINSVDTEVTNAIDNTLSPEIAKISNDITKEAIEAKDIMQESFNFYSAYVTYC